MQISLTLFKTKATLILNRPRSQQNHIRIHKGNLTKQYAWKDSSQEVIITSIADRITQLSRSHQHQAEAREDASSVA
jgi:hypothetical protein